MGSNQSALKTNDIQRQLGVTSDGIFGAQTTAAVKAFQQQNGLVVDGIVGPKTQAALQAKMSGSTPVGTVGKSGIVSSSDAGEGLYNTETGRLNNTTGANTGNIGEQKKIRKQTQNADGTQLITYSDGTTETRGIPNKGDIATETEKLDDDTKILKEQVQKQNESALKRNQELFDLTNKYADETFAATAASLTSTYAKQSEIKQRLLQKTSIV